MVTRSLPRSSEFLEEKFVSRSCGSSPPNGADSAPLTIIITGPDALRLDFDRRLMLQFRGSTITSDAGLLAYRELDDALGLTDTGADTLADARTGKNGHHRLAGLLRQSIFGRLAGYEDVNDADRLCRDPAMRWVVGDQAITGSAASASQMGRFETKWLSLPKTRPGPSLNLIVANVVSCRAWRGIGPMRRRDFIALLLVVSLRLL